MVNSLQAGKVHSIGCSQIRATDWAALPLEHQGPAKCHSFRKSVFDINVDGVVVVVVVIVVIVVDAIVVVVVVVDAIVIMAVVFFVLICRRRRRS